MFRRREKLKITFHDIETDKNICEKPIVILPRLNEQVILEDPIDHRYRKYEVVAIVHDPFTYFFDPKHRIYVWVKKIAKATGDTK